MSHSTALRLAGLTLAAGVALALATRCTDPLEADGSSEGGAARAPGECRGCHVDACERWERSPHALTTRAAVRASVPLEVATESAVTHAPGASAFRARGERFEIDAPDDDGKRRAYPLEIVVGVRRMHMLVVRMDDGRLQVAPAMQEVIAPDRTGPWFDYTHLLFGAEPGAPPPAVAPGEPSFWTGPDRSFDAKCARCHMSGRVPMEPVEGTGPRSQWRSLGVDCVSCHGDGAAHVRHWNVPGATRNGDPVPVLAGLPKAEAIAVCLPCHLEGEVVDPRGAERHPADPLAWIEPTLLDDLVRTDATARPAELIYEGLSFLTSTCAEKGRLTCLSCHEVHGSPKPFSLKVAPEDDTVLCASCHAAIAAAPAAHTHHLPESTGSRCTTCHMPAVPVERGHGAVRDHTLGVPWPGGPDRAPDACTWCHTGARAAPPGAPRLDAAQIGASHRAWWPSARRLPWWVDVIERAREADEGVAPDVAALARDTGAPRLVRASAARLLRNFPDRSDRALLPLAADRDPLLRRAALRGLSAVRTPEADAAFRAALADPEPSVRFVAARAALDGWERVRSSRELLAAVVPVLAEDAAAVPEDHVRWFRLGAARQLAGDVRGAIEAYERKLALDPHASAVRATVERLRAKLPR